MPSAKRTHPVFIAFACGCRRPREEAKRGKSSLVCPRHNGVSVRYDLLCERCGNPFSVGPKGRNAFFCEICKKPKGAGRVAAYQFKCGHREAWETVRLAGEGRRPVCSICEKPGVDKLIMLCGCGEEFETSPNGGSSKRCPQCARVHAAVSKDHKPAKKRPTQELYCTKCKVRKRRMPEEGENPAFVRYCYECHTEITGSAMAVQPKALPEPIRVLPPGDKLEHYFVPYDRVQETAEYYSRLCAPGAR